MIFIGLKINGNKLLCPKTMSLNNVLGLELGLP